MNFSTESLERVSETYRKIRNTIRFMLGNLYDFAPDTESVALENMGELDRWALSRAASVFEKVEKAYENYEFHQVYHLITNLCVVDLSALYFDILKDRLYTAGKKSPERRSSQTAMWLITDALIRVLAPVLSFTSEEILGFMPASRSKPESVFFSEYPNYSKTISKWSNPKLEENFSGIWAVRNVVLKSLGSPTIENHRTSPRSESRPDGRPGSRCRA